MRCSRQPRGYSGGPGGIRHEPTMEERHAMQVQHLPRRASRNSTCSRHGLTTRTTSTTNHGHPQQVAIARPLPAERITGRGRRGIGVNGNAGARRVRIRSSRKHHRPRPGLPAAETSRTEAAGFQDNRPGRAHRHRRRGRTTGSDPQRPESRPSSQPRTRLAPAAAPV